jgi:nucleoside-diphosphate-sugar epimerase
MAPHSSTTFAVPSGYSLFQIDLDHIAREADSVWRDFAGASIFITGGTGFFGMWLIEGILWANTLYGLNLHVTVLSRDPEQFLAGRGKHLRSIPCFTVLAGDICAFASGSARFTHIIHAASESKTDSSVNWASSHLTAALEGTRRIVDLAAEHGSKAVLLTSSGAVYQRIDPPSTEGHVEGPGRRDDYTSIRSVYAEAKRMMEVLLAAGSERYGYRVAIARCFAFSGPYMPLTGGLALGNFLRDVLAGRDIVVESDGTAMRSYLYGADLAVWLLTILAKGENCRPYNVGGSKAISIADLAREVSGVAGRPGSVIIRKREEPGALREAYLPSLHRACSELGVRVAIDLPESVRRSLAWFGRYRTS